MGYGTRQPPLNATAPRRRAAGGGNAATANRQTPPKPYSGQRRSTKATVASDAVTTFGKRPGFSAPGRLLRASITNAAPSVRTSRRGSVLAAASHKSSAAVSSSAAGSNTARYFTPGGTGTSASGAAKATATPHFFEQVGAVAGRKEGLPAVTLPGTSPGYCAIRCGTHALDTPWGSAGTRVAGSCGFAHRPRYRRP